MTQLLVLNQPSLPGILKRPLLDVPLRPTSEHPSSQIRDGCGVLSPLRRRKKAGREADGISGPLF